MKWPQVQLKQVSLFGPQYGANASAAPWTGARPRYIRITDIDQNGKLLDREIVEASTQDTADYTLTEGDLLFARSGNTVGKTYRHDPKNGDAVFAGYLIRFRLNPKVINSKFAFYFTQCPSYKTWVVSKKRVAGQPNVNGTEYSALNLPLPAPREQNRIVELLEQADALRQKRAEADALADRIRPALFHKLFGDPTTNPKNFPRAKLGSVITETAYGTSVSSNTDAQGIPVLRMNNITLSGKLNLDDVKYVELDDAELRRHKLEPGDILFNRTNSRELVGKTGLWRGEMPAVAASYLIRVKVDRAQAYPEFVWAWLNTGFIKSQLFETARRAIGMANINATELRALPILLPPTTLQKKFVDCLEQLHMDSKRRVACCDSVESLFKTMLHRAFTGELTAQWREAHLKELLAEMEQQVKALKLPANGKN